MAKPQSVVFDGTNILRRGHRGIHSKGGRGLSVLLTLVNHYLRQGTDIICRFDASTWHDFKTDPEAAAVYDKLLQRFPDYFDQVEKRSEADEYLLPDAASANAIVVSLDDYVKFEKDFPWIRDDGRLVKINDFRDVITLRPCNRPPETIPLEKDLGALIAETERLLRERDMGSSINRIKAEPTSTRQYAGPKVQAIARQADIVFCIDATASMGPCIADVKRNVDAFVRGLESTPGLDYRLRLIAYRDLHDPKCGTPWEVTDFTSSVDSFCAQLAAIEAKGGGDEPESTLDALHQAIGSVWRAHDTHKTIILFTDANSHPTLHASPLPPPHNGVERVIQQFQTLRHSLLFMKVPRFPIYERIDRSMRNAEQKIVADYVPVEEAQSGLKSVNWLRLLEMLGKMVSSTSVVVAKRSS